MSAMGDAPSRLRALLTPAFLSEKRGCFNREGACP